MYEKHRIQIYCPLNVVTLFTLQGPIGPPGNDGERGVDGAKVLSWLLHVTYNKKLEEA